MFKKFLAKIAGKWLGSKLKLEEGPMDDKKPWYKSKTILTGIVAVLLSAYGSASTQFGLPPVPDWIYAILASIGIYTRATATKTIGS